MRVVPEGSGHVVVIELIHVVKVFPGINPKEDVIAWGRCRDMGSMSVKAMMRKTWEDVLRMRGERRQHGPPPRLTLSSSGDGTYCVTQVLRTPEGGACS